MKGIIPRLIGITLIVLPYYYAIYNTIKDAPNERLVEDLKLTSYVIIGITMYYVIALSLLLN